MRKIEILSTCNLLCHRVAASCIAWLFNLHVRRLWCLRPFDALQLCLASM